MLKKCDLTKKTDTTTYVEKIASLQVHLGELQRQLREKKIPVIILVEGWNASGITVTIQELIRYLRPPGLYTLFDWFTDSPREKQAPDVAVLEPYSRSGQDRDLCTELVQQNSGRGNRRTRVGTTRGSGHLFHQPVRAGAH